MNIKELWGSWDLISFSHTILETKVKTNIMGDNPNGTIIFTEDNCVSVIITNESRKTSNKIEDSNYLYNSMMAYMGRYDLNGNKCDFHIEISWNPSWVGLTLQREIILEDDKLIINTLPQVGIDGNLSTATLTWKRKNNI
ncbi:lipocalin-like domain-containing protein [Photobacterium kishitanii]|uniref:lipocalin-like domain-containing protein n=1 Tax=Photobacterium kishitanii TaxID=318456 RepID=UPI0027397589|nr:lipocalin-like domain-containing protein [Photobacterium kishitanii]